MKVGMMVPNYARWFRGEGIVDTCEKGKELELDALCLVDHVIATPRQYVGMGNGYMDCWSAMSYLAAVTDMQGWRPILTNAVVVVPYRPAIQQAKEIATIDSLSNGRVIVGAGSGYMETEFTDLNLDVTKRGEMTDEYLACMKELWTHPVASFHGKYVNFDERTISVRPAQQPHPPILYGSHGARPRRRIAERYQGTIQGPGRDVESQRAFDSDMADLNHLWKEYGRAGKPFQMAYVRGHLTAEEGQEGKIVMKGVTAEGQALTEANASIKSGPRINRTSEERVYGGAHPLISVSTMVDDLRRLESVGTDLAIVWLESYRYGNLDNLGMQLQQMELLAEHVLPKVNRERKPIEMDFDGKLSTPLSVA